MTITLHFYDDVLDEQPIARSIFLAGPTARGVRRTEWRAKALELLEAKSFDGSVIIPEFREGLFDELAPRRFGTGESPVPSMRRTSHGILHWETTGIENASVVLFWMPFAIAAEDDPASLPGFTTRAEVSRELVRDPSRIVLGIPRGALSSSHIRYHAHRAGVTIAETLEDTVAAACERVAARS
jgi:hypothetical protein